MSKSKRLMSSASSCSSQLVEESSHLLEASKKWRMEIRNAIKSEKPYIELGNSV